MNANQRLSVCAALLLAAAFSLFLLAPPHVLAQPQVQFFDKPTDARAFIGHMNGKWYFRSQLSLHVYNDQFQHVSSAKLKWPKAWKKVVVEDVRIVGNEIIALGYQSDLKLNKREFVRFRWEESGAVVPLAEKGMPVVVAEDRNRGRLMASAYTKDRRSLVYDFRDRMVKVSYSSDDKWLVFKHVNQPDRHSDLQINFLVFDSTLQLAHRFEVSVPEDQIKQYANGLYIDRKGTIHLLPSPHKAAVSGILRIDEVSNDIMYRFCPLGESHFKSATIEVPGLQQLRFIDQKGYPLHIIALTVQDMATSPTTDRIVVMAWDSVKKFFVRKLEASLWEINASITYEKLYGNRISLFVKHKGLEHAQKKYPSEVVNFDIEAVRLNGEGIYVALTDQHQWVHESRTPTAMSYMAQNPQQSYASAKHHTSIHDQVHQHLVNYSAHVYFIYLSPEVKRLDCIDFYRRENRLSGLAVISISDNANLQLLLNDRRSRENDMQGDSSQSRIGRIIPVVNATWPPTIVTVSAGKGIDSKRLLTYEPRSLRSIATYRPVHSLGQGRFLVFFLNHGDVRKCVPAILKF